MALGNESNLYKVIAAKTASYQIDVQDIGKIFTNRGAVGTITLTLPVVGDIQSGWHCRFFGVADQIIVIASWNSLDNIVTFNDAGADTLTTTAGELIGVGFEFVWDGTGWLAFQMGAEATTVTIA